MSQIDERTQRTRQIKLQNRLAEQAIEANRLRFQREQAALRSQSKTTANPDRLKALEERLDKLETVLTKVIDMETDRWKKNGEALDILAAAELERIKKENARQGR